LHVAYFQDRFKRLTIATALAVFENKLWVTFLANNNSNSVLICSSTNGQAWSGNIII